MPPNSFTAFNLNNRNDAQGAGVISTGEIDYYFFQASVDGDYTFSATKSGGNNNKLNPELAVFDGSGNLLGYSDDISPTNPNSQLTLSLVAGQDYYLAVTNKQGTQSGPKYSYNWAIDGPAPGTSDTSYDIDLFVTMTNAPTAEGTPLWDLFQQAVARWESIITADLPDATYQGIFIDDLRIEATVTKIDGVNAAVNTLAYASPNLVRSDYLPLRGSMTFDEADFATWNDDFLSDVIVHEMGHVLGVGSIWKADGLVAGGGRNLRYTGPNALDEYRQIFNLPNATGIPLDSTGGHWRESDLGNELMTPYLIGVPNPLSRITIASLKDVGYTVDLSQADPYAPPTASAQATSDSSSKATTDSGLEAILVQSTAAPTGTGGVWYGPDLPTLNAAQPPLEPTIEQIEARTASVPTPATSSRIEAPTVTINQLSNSASRRAIELLFDTTEGWQLDKWVLDGD